MQTFNIEKKDIVAGRDRWIKFISQKNFTVKDFVFIAFADEINIYNKAFPFFMYLKERKNLKNIYLVTDMNTSELKGTENIDYILSIPNKNEMKNIIKFFKTVKNNNNIVFLSIKNENGSGVEELIKIGEITETEYINISLLDLGALV